MVTKRNVATLEAIGIGGYVSLAKVQTVDTPSIKTSSCLHFYILLS